MSLVKLPIDTKSLHYNIKNDNKTGHTATVATPLRQGNTYNDNLGHIFELPMYKNFESNELLLASINKNARTSIRVLGVFVFDKFAVNGVKIDCDKQFCIYVREEIDPTKVQCGRIKVHYPLSFRFVDDELDIDNKVVINAVSSFLHDYAFLVSAFEYNMETEVLNFRATIVGEPQVPYSKVFINEKGAGNKFVLSFNDITDNYDFEIAAFRKTLGDEISPINYLETMEKYRLEAKLHAESVLWDTDGVTCVTDIGNAFPYAPYDFEYVQSNETKYALVFFTATDKEYFAMTSKRIRFCNDFTMYTQLLLFTDILNKPQFHKYTMDQANHFGKDIGSIIYTKGDCNE